MTAIGRTAGGKELLAPDPLWEEQLDRIGARCRKHLSEGSLWRAGLAASTAVLLAIVLLCLFHAFQQWTFTGW